MAVKKYDITYSDIVVNKDIPKLDYEVRKIIKRMINEKLGTYPKIFGKPLRGNLKPAWVLRIGDYRVVYDIYANEVKVFSIAHRSVSYD
jgi:mRNA-degrading endonuclease RelE of RelBE toxin-antitoxin system